MKKKTKFLCMLLALAMILTMVPASMVSAASSTVKLTVYPSSDGKVQKLCGYDNNGTVVTRPKNQHLVGIQITKNFYTVKSSNTSVLSVNKKKSSVFGPDYASIYCTVKKTGKTKISVKSGKTWKKAKTSSITVKAIKYTNPLASLKLGSTTISGTNFNNSSVLRLKYSDYANKTLSLNSLKLKKNWYYGSSIALVTPSGSGYKADYLSEEEDGIFKCSTSDSSGNVSLTSPKITKKGSWLDLYVYNNKGQGIQLTILFE